jgi:Tol biopolymer transport system component
VRLVGCCLLLQASKDAIIEQDASRDGLSGRLVGTARRRDDLELTEPNALQCGMRIAALLVAVAAVGLAAAQRSPEQIVYARVSPNPGGLGVFIAAADGSGERPLLGAPDLDYDPAFAPDGDSIVFTSDREGSADLFRVKADGNGLERLTSDPAYDDQAAFSPDGRQLVFVSTRLGGFARLFTMDIASKLVRALTSGSGAGGDFRPAWSPDGAWIAFSSGRGSDLPFAQGRWERLQPAALYMVRPDGSGLTRISEPGRFCGSPKWNRDNRKVIAYCMTAEQTLSIRRALPESGPDGSDTRLVAFDLISGTAEDVKSAAGVMFNPSYVGDTVGYVRKFAQGPGAGIYYTDGRSGPKGDIRSASWSPDGSRVVFHKRLAAPPPVWKPAYSRLSGYQLVMTGILASFSPAGDRMVMTGRPPIPGRPFGSSIFVAAAGVDKGQVIYQDDSRNVLAPQWSPRGDRIIFSVGQFGAFFNGFNTRFSGYDSRIQKPVDRAEGGAQVAIINADGSGFREITSGPDNNAFPSMAPDGARFVYRSFGAGGEDGLKIMNIETKAVTPLTRGYDNFPLWSPRGDLIMFSRLTAGNYEIWTIKPDGKGERKITSGRGTDAHQGWSPDGEWIVFASSRMGYKDEAIYTDAPQPYGEIFVMRYDGRNVQQLTDNQWEEGTPAWRPVGRTADSTARR